MGAPKVIAVPTKSYVAINSYKCDKSISPTLCDLGRVSNIAAVVTIPRTANFVNRNSVPQSVSSLPYKKRPISEVLDCANSNSFHENVPTATSEITTIASHKKIRYTPESESSTSILANQSTIKTNPDKNGVSNPHVKRMKNNSTETFNKVSSQNVSAANKKNNSVSYAQNTTRIENTHLPFPHSTIQTIFVLPALRRSQETTAQSPLQRNQHDRLHYSNTPQLPYHQNVQLPSSGMGQLPTDNSLSSQLQQQNQQLHNERCSQETTAHSHLQRNQHDRLHDSKNPQLLNHQNVQLPSSGMGQLPTQISLSKQHQQQNQQLRNENVQLQKQLSLFRQLIKNPQRLNQVIARLEQRAH